MFVPKVPNPFDDDAQRGARLAAELQETPRRSWTLFISGWVCLAVFGMLVMFGLPGTGVVLVPIGLLLIIGGGIQLAINRLAG